MDDKDNRPLFQGMDELERRYAPQQLPSDDPEQRLVELDGESGPTDGSLLNEPPAAAPVASMGNAPSAAMAPPNIGHEDHGGAPGDPETQARYPMDDSGTRNDEE